MSKLVYIFYVYVHTATISTGNNDKSIKCQVPVIDILNFVQLTNVTSYPGYSLSIFSDIIYEIKDGMENKYYLRPVIE